MKHAVPVIVSALGALAGLGACADATDGIDAQCHADQQCQHGLECSFDFCVDTRPNALEVQARIIPPASSGLLAQQVGALSLTDGPNLLVTLLDTVHVRGVFTQRGVPALFNVAGEIEVRASGTIDGLDQRFTATSLNGPDRFGYGFDLAVLPGRSYEGIFRPSDTSLPRFPFTLPREAVDAGRFDLELPARSAYVTVRGRVQRGATNAPVLGARVVVLTNKTEVAAVTTTDDIRGMFEVLVAPGIERVRLEIEAPEKGPIFPDFVTDEFVLDGGDLTVVVPDPPLDVAPYDAAITVLAPDGKPAAGLSVTIQGVLLGGTIRRTTLTNDAGVARLNVLNGPYECLVIVPEDLPWASWHGFVDLGVAGVAVGGGSATVQLAARPTLSGRVVDAFGAPVGAGAVTLERDIEKLAGEELVIAPPDVTLDLADDGSFSARVDPGTWDAMIAPDPATGAPNTHEPDIEVGADGLSLDLGLPTPGLLHLTVGAPDGTFLPDVTVELWEPGEPPAKPRLLARGTTSAQGFVDLLVPHEASAR